MKEYERENLISAIEHGEASGEPIVDPLYLVARILLGIEGTLQFFRDRETRCVRCGTKFKEWRDRGCLQGVWPHRSAPEEDEDEEAVARVQGLEKAMVEIQRFVKVGLGTDSTLDCHASHQLVGIREIVDSSVKLSVGVGPEEASDA